MAIVTATEVTQYSDISCSAGTTTLTLLIPIVQSRINQITNNYFTTDLYQQGTYTFDPTAGTIVGVNSFVDDGFADGDEIYIYHSYRNDGYYTIGDVSTVTITVASGESVVSEPSGRSIIISVVDWPIELKYIASQMIKFDYDDRPTRSVGVQGESLGPYSVTYGGRSGAAGANPTPFGYPAELIDALSPYTLARVK